MNNSVLSASDRANIAKYALYPVGNVYVYSCGTCGTMDSVEAGTAEEAVDRCMYSYMPDGKIHCASCISSYGQTGEGYEEEVRRRATTPIWEGLVAKGIMAYIYINANNLGTAKALMRFQIPTGWTEEEVVENLEDVLNPASGEYFGSLFIVGGDYAFIAIN